MHFVGTGSESRIRDRYFLLNSCMYKAFRAGQAARLLESSEGARLTPCRDPQLAKALLGLRDQDCLAQFVCT